MDLPKSCFVLAAIPALLAAPGPRAAGQEPPGDLASATPPPPATVNLPAIVGSRRLAVHFRVDGAAAPVEYTLHFTRDGGASWMTHDQRHRGGSPLPFTAPSDGRYGFSITARDAVGLEAPGPSPGSPPQIETIVDTTPPVIRIIHPRPERSPVASMMGIEWSVSDENLGETPLEVSYSLDGGPWSPIWTSAPSSGRRQWNMPFTRGELRLRFLARDLAGNVSEDVTRTAYLLAPAEVERRDFLIVPPVSRRLTVPVYYRLVSSSGEVLPPSKLRSVVSWYRRPGEDWSRGDVDRDRTSPLLFRAPGDGHYDLLVSAVAISGEVIPADGLVTPDAPPPLEAFPHGSVLVDTREPLVRILAPPDGARYQWGSTIGVRFDVQEENPADQPPVVEYSIDGGATWKPFAVETRLRSPNRDGRAVGDLEFRLPMLETSAFLVRVTVTDIAGNRGFAQTNPRLPIHIGDFSEDPRQVARDLHLRAADLLAQTGDPAAGREAVRLLERSVTTWNASATAHHDLAVALERTHGGDLDPALRKRILDHYRRAVATDPGDLVLRFSVIEAFLRLSGSLASDAREKLRREAREMFDRIRWRDLLAEPQTDEERWRLAEYRRKYIDWKENQLSWKESS